MKITTLSPRTGLRFHCRDATDGGPRWRRALAIPVSTCTRPVSAVGLYLRCEVLWHIADLDLEDLKG
ncbi:hypothetical protein N7523_010927 [Penicillium sp. IBT 18751x]|nr:hypothetical protein N7523_010927 [Penicillium sp. IBT 18751x]